MDSERAGEREIAVLRKLSAFLRYLDKRPEDYPDLAQRFAREGVFGRLAMAEATAAFSSRPQVLSDFNEYERAVRAMVGPSPVDAGSWTHEQVAALADDLQAIGMRAMAVYLRAHDRGARPDGGVAPGL